MLNSNCTPPTCQSSGLRGGPSTNDMSEHLNPITSLPTPRRSAIFDGDYRSQFDSVATRLASAEAEARAKKEFEDRQRRISRAEELHNRLCSVAHRDDMVPSMEKFLQNSDVEIDLNRQGTGFSFHNTCLIRAAMNPTPENKAFRFFISQGCDPQMPNDNGNTALMMACTVCHTAVIRFLVQCADVDVNEQNHHGMTAFMIACLNKDFPAMKILLWEGHADPDIPDSDGKSPLMRVSDQLGYEEVVEFLLHVANARLDVVDYRGQTAEFYVRNSHWWKQKLQKIQQRVDHRASEKQQRQQQRSSKQSSKTKPIAPATISLQEKVLETIPEDDAVEVESEWVTIEKEESFVHVSPL